TVVPVLVPFCWHKLRMDTFMRQVEEERLSGRVPFEKVNRIIGEQVGDVRRIGIPFTPTVHIEFRIVEHALTTKAHPVVEALPRLVVLVTHVPLAYEGRLVTFLLQIFREEPDGIRNGRLVVYHLVMVCELARQDTCATGRAERCRHKCIAQMYTFACHTVHARRFESRHLAHESHEVVAVVVCQNKDYIRSARIGRCLPLTACRQQRSKCCDGDHALATQHPQVDFLRHSVRVKVLLITSREFPPTITVNPPGSATYSILML